VGSGWFPFEASEERKLEKKKRKRKREKMKV